MPDAVGGRAHEAVAVEVAARCASHPAYTERLLNGCIACDLLDNKLAYARQFGAVVIGADARGGSSTSGGAAGGTAVMPVVT